MDKAIIQSGGIGDLIILVGAIRKLRETIKDCEVFVTFPDVYKFYTGETVRNTLEIETELKGKVDPKNIIFLNTFGYVFSKGSDHAIDPIKEYNHTFIKKFRLEHYLSVHPYKDGIAADLLMNRGFQRHTLPYEMLGLEDCSTPIIKPTRLNNWFGKYITIHDGVSTLNEGQVVRATKTWDLTSWADLVKMLKIKFPEHKIIQLGGSVSRRIKGVDYCFVGSFSIEDTFKILAHSDLHIDGDSGLVHAAYTFGVKSVVMFGPTPAKFFGYPENINIQSPFCSPCWWKNDTWLKDCPMAYSVPLCMNSIYPSVVMERISKDYP